MSNKLVLWYSSLIDFIEKKSSPDYRTRFHQRINPQEWSRWRKFISFYVVFFHSDFQTKILHFIDLSVLWIILIWFGYAILNVMYGLRFQQHPIKSPFDIKLFPLSSSSIFLIVTFIILVFMTVISYWRYIEFFRDRRYSVRLRVIFFIIYLILIGLAFYYFEFGRPGILQFLNPQLWMNKLGENPVYSAYLFLFLCPLVFFLCLFFLEMIVDTSLIIVSVIMVIYRSQTSFPQKMIMDVYDSRIPTNGEEDEKGFFVHDFKTNELIHIRKLAETNLEVTEKRSIPVAISLAVLAILASSSPIEKIINKFMELSLGVINIMVSATFMNKPPVNYSNTQLFIYAIFFTLGLILVGLLFQYLYSTIKNVGIQNVIAQVCTLVEYENEQKNEKKQKYLERRKLILWKRKW
jgi:hypothetical protein